jgi:REP element-mobilizing transposase RayT
VSAIPTAGATHASPLRRKSIRLQGYDYTQPGAYFVTLCTQDRACLFGEIVDGQMRSNAMGNIVADCWQAIPRHFQMVELDAWVAMPNHFHGIAWIADVGATHASPVLGNASPVRTSGPPRWSLGAIIGSFKSAATKRINALRGTPGTPVWQRNYHEHIIRGDESLNRIRQYILDNPAQWATDRENPSSHSA